MKHESPAAHPACRRPLAGPLSLAASPAGAPGRDELEAFVCAAFQRRHGARVVSFMPTLLSFRDGAGQLRGVVGLREALPQPLYLEQYLERPVEAAIGGATGESVGRGQVVEVGNLAGTNCRAAMRMVAQLPAYLLARDYRWIVFTATAAVQAMLQAFGAPLIELARADAARVKDGADHWGSYYQENPRVFAAYLPASRSIPGFSGMSHGR